MPSLPAYLAETAVAGWLVLGVPIVGRLRYRALRGIAGDRPSLYRRTVRRQWLSAVVAVAALLAAGIAPESLGLAPHLRAAVALAPALAELVAVGLAVVAVLRFQAARRPDRPWSARLLRPVQSLLPRTRLERRWFAAVAVSAGVTEEVLYRGILTLWFGQTFPGLGFGGAIVASSVAFGLAHAYQGPVGIVLTGVAGYAFGVMYGATGSLLLPMVVHALVDLRVLLVLPRPRSTAPALTSVFVGPGGSTQGPPDTGVSTWTGPLSSP